MKNIKLWTLTNEYAELIVNSELIRVEYTVNGDGRYIVSFDKESYFVDTLN